MISFIIVTSIKSVNVQKKLYIILLIMTFKVKMSNKVTNHTNLNTKLKSY